MAGNPKKVRLALDRGLAAHRASRMNEAEAAYREALSRDPRNGEALYLLGVLQYQTGRSDEAVRSVTAATRANPQHAESLRTLGVMLAELGRTAESVSALERSLALKPSPEIRNDLATALTRLASEKDKEEWKTTGQYDDELLQLADRAAQVHPGVVWTWRNLGRRLRDAGQWEAAEASLRKALEINPSDGEANLLIGSVLCDLERPEEAESHFLKVLEKDSTDTGALAGLGAALRMKGNIEGAIDVYRRSLSINAGDFNTLYNLANALHDSGQTAEAISAASRAIELDPSSKAVRYSRGLMRLVAGDFAGGWADCAARWSDVPRVVKQRPHVPLWDGRPVDGSVFIAGEQGIGDEILFATMIPDAVALQPRIILEVEPRLVTLMRRSFPMIEVVPSPASQDEVVDLPEVTHQTHMGELGRFFRRSLADFDSQQAYLAADRVRVGSLREKYAAASTGRPTVGISWMSKRKRMSKAKSLELRQLMPVFSNVDALFVDIQYGDTAEERRLLEADSGYSILHDSSIDSMLDLDGFAAQVAALDAVLTTSNSAAHFAGALGVPTWLIPPPPNAAFWYWAHTGERSLWYPSVRVLPRRDVGLDASIALAAREIADHLAGVAPRPEVSPAR